MAKKTRSEHYVSNKEFYKEMLEWQKPRLDFHKGDTHPTIKKKLIKYPKNQWHKIIPLDDMPSCIGEKIYKICNRNSFKPNFINYTYKDKLISEALYTCCRYADRFDPERSNNPFAYFTSITNRSFIKCINEEKKISNIKKKLYDKQLSDQNISNKNNYDVFYHNPKESEFQPITIINGKKSRVFKTENSYNKYINKKIESRIE